MLRLRCMRECVRACVRGGGQEGNSRVDGNVGLIIVRVSLEEVLLGKETAWAEGKGYETVVRVVVMQKVEYAVNGRGCVWSRAMPSVYTRPRPSRSIQAHPPSLR